MKKLLALSAAALAVAACGKTLPTNPKAATVIVANFDPGANPPVVPSPNDLATNPDSGLLNVPSGSSDADAEFAAYLNSLNGYPADSTGSTTFTGKLDPNTVTADNVKVFDWDGTTLTPVSGASVSYTEVESNTAPGIVGLQPPATGWTAGHTYVVAVVGYDAGVKGAKKEQVIGSPAFALVRSANPLVDGSGHATTDLIPSSVRDPAGRVADQGQTAAQLEQVRLHYKPFFDTLDAQGVSRATIAQLWSFRIADKIVTPTYILNPADPCSTKIPTPNDLAIDPTTGNVKAPTGCAGMTDSENEFITDYLNHLDGFPSSATASESFVGGKLAGNTVQLSDTSVLLVDLTAAAAGGTQPTATVAYDQTSNSLTITPPTDGWTKGDEIAVALLPGITGANGEQLVASDIFALVRSSSPLTDCDLTDPSTDPSTCHSALTLAPLTDAQAVALEQLRLGLSPVFDALGVDRSQVAMLWTFKIYDNPEMQFRLALNPSQVIIPFPFNGRKAPAIGTALQFYIPAADGGPGKINLPSAIPVSPALNTLDGFSTTAPIVTAFGGADARDLTDNANLDPTSVNPTTDDGGTTYTVGLMNLTGQEPAQFTACVNCGRASDLIVDGGEGAEPESLAIIPSIPLTERTTYAAYVTGSLKDTAGHAVVPTSAFALLRMKNPITDSAGNVLVPELAAVASPAELAILENVRQAYGAMFDQLDAAGLARGDLVLAWDFTTQTTFTSVAQIHALPQLYAAQGFPTNSNYVYDATTALMEPDGGGIPQGLRTGIGKILVSSYETPNLLHQDDGGMGPFNITNPVPQTVPMIIYEPTTRPTDGGALPVVIFGHGITGWRGQSAVLASSINQAGMALVAFDEPLHGDRSFCVGAGAAVGATDDAVCKAPTGQTATCDEDGSSNTYGRCLGTNPGLCMGSASQLGGAALGGDQVAGAIVVYHLPADVACSALGQGNCDPVTSHCEGATFATDSTGNPLISGWDFLDLTALNAYFWLPTRDHFRQDLVDLGQMELVFANDSTDGGALNTQLVAAGANALDAANLNYVGQSLGGILGTLHTAGSPAVNHAVLNVPGGNLANLLLTSPGLAPLRNPLLAGLSAGGIDPGTPAFDSFINFSQWVLDPADPVNSANFLAAPSPLAPANRAVLVQWIDNDEVVVNPATAALIASANRYTAAGLAPEATVTEYAPSETEWPSGTGHAAGRHGFLLDGFFGSSTQTCYTVKAQTEAATWLATGAGNLTGPVTSCP